MTLKGIILKAKHIVITGAGPAEFFYLKDHQNGEQATARIRELVSKSTPKTQIDIVFDTRVGFFVKGYNKPLPNFAAWAAFATNHPTQRILDPKKENAKLGFIRISVNPHQRKITTTQFHPFYEFAPITRVGMGSSIELQMERQLLTLFPGFKIQSGPNPKPGRIHQLEKRGRKIGQPEWLERAMQKTRKQVNANTLKANRARTRVA